MQKFLDITFNSRRFRKWTALLLIAAASLAISIPFACQAFAIDGPIELYYAQNQLEHPLAQGLHDYQYWGFVYDNYLNTHPRLLSLYFSVVIRVAGGISELPIHLSLIVFPFIGALGMYWLGRRFSVSGLAAALLFLASPMLMVSAHLEMVDVPGTCLWVAAIAAFIFAVDKRSNLLLALSLLLMLLTTQTFFQGLAVLPLALAYLLINRRFRLLNFLPVAATVALFGGYLAAVFLSNGQLPHFSYGETFQGRPMSLPELVRGNLTVLGGTLMFPLAAVAGCVVRWSGALVFAAASAIVWSWSAVKFGNGEYDLADMLLLSVLLPAGIAIVYLLAERSLVGILRRSRGSSQAGRDAVFLGVWFFGVLAYAVIHLNYPAPRHLLPILPPAALSLLMVWRTAVRRNWLRSAFVTAAIIFSFAFSAVLSISIYDTAEHNREVARWVHDNYADADLWYNGEGGFRYYMESYGCRMTPTVLNDVYHETLRPASAIENPQPGDYDVYSVQGRAWVPYPAVMQRLRPEQFRFFYNDNLLWSPCAGSDACWTNSSFLPYTIDTGRQLFDTVMVWRIDDEPNPLNDSQKEIYRQVGITWIDEMEEKPVLTAPLEAAAGSIDLPPAS